MLVEMVGKVGRKKRHVFEDGTSFEGGWEQGLFHGHGTLTWANGCVYEGEFRCGERHGHGICTFPGGEQYTGGWADGKMHGEGTLAVKGRVLTGNWEYGVPDFGPPIDGHKRFVFPDGRGVYNGHWRGCKRHGQGTFTFANGDVYKGMWIQGEMTGKGNYEHVSGDAYTGQFKEGQMHGKGTYIWRSLNQSYEGQWKDGVRDGYGRHFFSSASPEMTCGEFYDGSWKEGVMHGEGKYVDAGGTEHEGEWVDGVCPEVDFTHVPESGNFRYCFSGGTYEGDWANRNPHGQGRMIYTDGSVYMGGWKDFKFHGKGKLMQEGGVVFDGEWRDGRMHGVGRLETPPASTRGATVGVANERSLKHTDHNGGDLTKS